jgi:antagonist of KipI
MSITVVKPGLLSSFQDLGRQGHQHLGVPVGGAMDARAHRLANMLVGNTHDHATLEVTLAGPTLQFEAAACIAITGALLQPMINDRPVPNNRPLVVRAGDTLSLGQRQQGLRAYIAWHGGIELDGVLGSCSTYLRGKLGGYKGRALQKGDVLVPNKNLNDYNLDDLAKALWDQKIYLPATLAMQQRSTVRAMRGAHTALFTDASVTAFFAQPYRITAQSERMGYRLDGPTLTLKDPTQLLSEATGFGTVQVPPDGQPIVLMADRQTTGGYAKIAHVATTDLPFLAQSMPGDELRFTEISVEQAHDLDNQREDAFAQLHRALGDLRALFDQT